MKIASIKGWSQEKIDAESTRVAKELVSRYNDFDDIYDEAKSDIRPYLSEDPNDERQWDRFLNILQREWNLVHKKGAAMKTAVRSTGRECENCGHYLGDDEYQAPGSWSYRCKKCKFKYNHGGTPVTEQLAKFNGEGYDDGQGPLDPKIFSGHEASASSRLAGSLIRGVLKKADDFEDDPDLVEGTPNTFSDVSVPENVEEMREAAQQDGFKWEGLFDEDEDGKTFNLKKTVPREPEETLYISENGNWLFEESKKEGNGLESLVEALKPEPEPEDYEAQAAQELEEEAAGYISRISEYLHGEGELEYGEALSEGGRDSAWDYITDIIRDKFHLEYEYYNRDLYEKVTDALRKEFIDNITDEDEEEFERLRDERTETWKSTAVQPKNMTPQEIKKLEQAADLTWNAIGDDILKMYNNPRITLSAEHVAELVQDANHLDSYGNLDPKLLAKFNALTPAERDWIMQQAFPPGSKYGF